MYRLNTKQITYSAIIAALYIILTEISNLFGLASGAVQVRISEALTILPVFTSAAIPGLFVGCFISNVLCGNLFLDVIFGSVATLLGALGTYYWTKSRVSEKNKYVGFIFPVVSNTLIIPFILKYVYCFEGALWYFAVTVGLGEIISCGVLGILLYKILKKKRFFENKNLFK